MRRFAAGEAFFARWIVGEHHLRHGDQREAITQFREALGYARQENDILYRERVKWLLESAERESLAVPREGVQ